VERLLEEVGQDLDLVFPLLVEPEKPPAQDGQVVATDGRAGRGRAVVGPGQLVVGGQEEPVQPLVELDALLK
jgi:hypothetical protein